MRIFYDFPPFRPPSEASSYLVRIVRGCNWNKCSFCGMYKSTKFYQRKKEEIIEDINKIKLFFPPSRTAFIGDSNPIIHRDIVEIIRYLKERYPEIERITAYARIKTVANMNDEKLSEIKNAGLKRLHMGLESGCNEVLEDVNKGITAEDAIIAGKKARKFFEFTYYIITGLGGKEKSEMHAKETAEVINKAKPTFVRVRNLTIVENTLMEKTFDRTALLNAEQQLLELKTIVEGIKVETEFLCDHVSNYLFTKDGPIFFGVNGKLPNDKKKILEELEDALNLVRILEKSGEKVLTSNDMRKLGYINL
ncbi:MAG: radical SAM protein [Archaeoglobales archaeon]|nr:radical SAM protein [Archaeoglobales archaeon]